MEVKIIGRESQMKREGINPNQYTASLLKKGYGAGTINEKTIYRVQSEMILLLKDLLSMYTKGESTSVAVETAERILCSMNYCIDAYISSFQSLEEALGILTAKSVQEIHQKGVEIVRTYVEDTEELYKKLRREKLDIPLEVYNSTVMEAIPAFFRGYGVVFDAQNTMASIDYPLVFDDMRVQGIFYIRNYLKNLETETKFCGLFSKGMMVQVLKDYSRVCGIYYKDCLVNVFELLVNHSVFSVLAGNDVHQGKLSTLKFQHMESQLSRCSPFEISGMVREAGEKMMELLEVRSPKLQEYIYDYIKILVKRIENAVNNQSLHNIILDGHEEEQESRTIFQEGERISDQIFRRMMGQIRKCNRVEDKIHTILTTLCSAADFLDILQADCLFDDEYVRLFEKLGDKELAVLGKGIFFEELREGQLHLSDTFLDQKESEMEWQVHYLGFIKSLPKERRNRIGTWMKRITLPFET